ncbi:MAG: N-acetyltransferase [Hyphomicrobiaceae bacterium]|nr:N-acetyltransferase [Hyphomicrobiaceae bacterium]MCC0023613.1 N-acetyltransferase [Hyphomicrobiaceae bacterium]
MIARMIERIDEIAPADWDGLLSRTNGVPDNPFSRYDFLWALEASGCATGATGWQPQHVVIERENKLLGAMPLYLKSHSQGEYVFDFGWADAFERAGGRYYPKLQCAIPFTPASAPKFLTRPGMEELRPELLATAEQIARGNNISSVHATFLSEPELQLAEDRNWLTRLDTQFHWENQSFADFDQFLETLSSRKRKAIRKERNSVAESGVNIVWKQGSDIVEADWDDFFTFYMDTGSRKWGQPYLNREFFSLVTERMADQIVLMFAYRNGSAVAGALNFLGSDTLFGRYWGCTEHVPFLHFELCYYQAIDYAIAHKLPRVEAGAQGEHKLARGYAPAVTRSAHFITHPGLRDAVAKYLEAERRSVLRNNEILADYAPFKKNG